MEIAGDCARIDLLLRQPPPPLSQFCCFPAARLLGAVTSIYMKDFLHIPDIFCDAGARRGIGKGAPPSTILEASPMPHRKDAEMPECSPEKNTEHPNTPR